MNSRRLLPLMLALGAVTATQVSWAQSAERPSVPAPESAIVGPGLYVGDVERSLKYYRDLLGMTVRMQYGPAERPDVVIGFGFDPAQAGIMLLSDRAGPTPRTIEHGHGYDRIAIRLADLRGTHARLIAAGHTVSDIKVVHEVFLMAMATDPDGYKVELLGPKPTD